jgi:hypothetical protein
VATTDNDQRPAEGTDSWSRSRVSPEEVRREAEELVRRMERLVKAEGAAIEQAETVYRSIDNADLPRLWFAALTEAGSVREDVSLNQGDAARALGEARDLLELVDLAVRDEEAGEDWLSRSAERDI